MAEFKLNQTGQQVQADLDKIENINSSSNTFTGSNTFEGETKLSGVVKDSNGNTGANGQILKSNSAGKLVYDYETAGNYVITALTETSDEIELTVEST